MFHVLSPLGFCLRNLKVFMEEMEEASIGEINLKDITAQGEKDRNDRSPGVSREERGIWNYLESHGKSPQG